MSAPKRGTILPAKLPVASMETERTGCFRLKAHVEVVIAVARKPTFLT
ncbi:MAG: hypothetical protein LKE81_08100 [Acetobacter sp.]|nr:hypothetical protein [Acetobacter sp.]MCH4061362.1 hypothetical protein [Acetobacter sp.]MCH4088299.1 hypothetical protein [Acetobacter sp.]